MLTPSPSSNLLEFVGLMRPHSDVLPTSPEVGVTTESEQDSPSSVADAFKVFLAAASATADHNQNQVRDPKDHIASPWNDLLREQPMAATRPTKIPDPEPGNDGMVYPRNVESIEPSANDRRDQRIGIGPDLPLTTYQNQRQSDSRPAIQEGHVPATKMVSVEAPNVTDDPSDSRSATLESHVPATKIVSVEAPNVTDDPSDSRSATLESHAPTAKIVSVEAPNVTDDPSGPRPAILEGHVPTAKIVSVEAPNATDDSSSPRPAILQSYAPATKMGSDEALSVTDEPLPSDAIAVDEPVGTLVPQRKAVQHMSRLPTRDPRDAAGPVPELAIETPNSQSVGVYTDDADSVLLSDLAASDVKRNGQVNDAPMSDAASSPDVVANSQPKSEVVERDKVPLGESAGSFMQERTRSHPEVTYPQTRQSDIAGASPAVFTTWQPRLTRLAIDPEPTAWKDTAEPLTENSPTHGASPTPAQSEAVVTTRTMRQTTSNQNPHESTGVLRPASVGPQNDPLPLSQDVEIVDRPPLRNTDRNRGRQSVADRDIADVLPKLDPLSEPNPKTTHESISSSRITSTPNHAPVPSNAESATLESVLRPSTSEVQVIPVVQSGNQPRGEVPASTPRRQPIRAPLRSLSTLHPPKADVGQVATEAPVGSSITNSSRLLNGSMSGSSVTNHGASDFVQPETMPETRRSVITAETPRVSSPGIEGRDGPRIFNQQTATVDEGFSPRPLSAIESIRDQPADPIHLTKRFSQHVGTNPISRSTHATTRASWPRVEISEANTEQLALPAAERHASNVTLNPTLPAMAVDVADVQLTETVARLKSVPSQVQQVVQAADLRRAGDSIEIELDPPELGRVVVQLEADGPRISARFIVGDGAVAAVLEQGLMTLVESLQSADLVVDDFQIDLQHENDGTGEDHRSSPFSDRRESRASAESHDQSVEPARTEHHEEGPPRTVNMVI